MIERVSSDTLYVYPTALKVEQVLSLGARRTGCLFDCRVVTFPELTNTLFSETGWGEPLLPDSMATVVMRAVLSQPASHLKHLAPIASSAGLARTLLNLVREFKGAYMSPADLDDLAGRVSDEEVRQRLDTLNQLYRGYQQALSRLGWIDRHDREWRVLSFLEQSSRAGVRPRCLGGMRKVVFAELYDFSVTQFLIATALISLIGDAELVIQAEGVEVDGMGFCQRTWNRFVEDPAIADKVLPEFVNRGGRRGNLSALLTGLFRSRSAQPQTPDGSVELLTAQSRYYETEEIGREVRRLLERGWAPDKIAVLARDLSVYGDLVEDVFGRYRIPTYFRKGRPLAAIGIVKHLVNIIKNVTEGFPYHRLSALVKSPYLSLSIADSAWVLSDLGYVDNQTATLADCVRRAELGVKNQRERPLSLGLQRSDPDAVVRLIEGARPIGDLLERLASLDRPRSCQGHVAALRSLTGEIGLRVVCPGDEGEISNRRDSLAYAHWQDLLCHLESIGDGLAEGELSFEDFASLLLAALEGMQLEEPTLAAGGVRILSVEDARGLEFDTVFLLGLDDGTFPAAEGDNPLLPDRHRVEMNRKAAEVLRGKLGAASAGMPLGVVFRTSSEVRRRDPFLFFLAASMAGRRLVLSYPVTNEKGNPTVRSPFIDEVAALVDLAGEDSSSPPAGRIVPGIEDCFEVEELINRLALAGQGGIDKSLARKVGEERLLDIQRRSAIERKRAAFFLGRIGGSGEKVEEADSYLGRLRGGGADLGRAMVGRIWSPTALDDLAACPFKFFAAHLLCIRPPRATSPEPDRSMRGELVHLLLREFFSRYPRLSSDAEEGAERMRRFLADSRELLGEQTKPGASALFDLAWEDISEVMLEILACERSWQDELAEGESVRRFLEHPFNLHIEDHRNLEEGEAISISVRGRIDRVDLTISRQEPGLRRLRVVDYKLSRSQRYRALLDPARGLGRTSFQIPLYLMSVLNDASVAEGMRDDTALEGCYYLLKSENKLLVRELSPDLFVIDPARRATPGSVEPVANRLVDLFARAAQGYFDVDPLDCQETCHLRLVCRYQRPPATGVQEEE